MQLNQHGMIVFMVGRPLYGKQKKKICARVINLTLMINCTSALFQLVGEIARY